MIPPSHSSVTQRPTHKKINANSHNSITIGKKIIKGSLMYSPRFADLKWLTLTISLLKLANDDIIEAIAWFLVTLYLARYFNNLNNTPPLPIITD